MVLAPKETTVAYRCPECGSLVMSMVGVFTLTADMMRLKCPCGHSELEILYTKDKKIRLHVPCFACPTAHSYMLTSQIFFERELFTLPCAYTGLDICFIGRAEQVQEAVAKAEEELMELLGDTDFETFAGARGTRGELTDPQVYDIVLYVVQELADEGAIHCRCPEGEGEYKVDLAEDRITVRCETCGASVEIPIGSLTTAQDFLRCDSLELT